MLKFMLLIEHIISRQQSKKLSVLTSYFYSFKLKVNSIFLKTEELVKTKYWKNVQKVRTLLSSVPGFKYCFKNRLILLYFTNLSITQYFYFFCYLKCLQLAFLCYIFSTYRILVCCESIFVVQESFKNDLLSCYLNLTFFIVVNITKVLRHIH